MNEPERIRRALEEAPHAPGAVAARGFAQGLDVEVPIALRDATFPQNDGAFVLRVRNGQGELIRGGSGDVRLPIGGFASLYTGWASTAMLRRAGRLAGGSDVHCAALDAAFAGPTPWLVDEF